MRAFVHAYIVTCDEKFSCFEDGMLILDGELIHYCGPYDTSKLDNVQTIIDYTGHWIMPGLVNVHTHSPMSLLRGVEDDAPLMAWLEQSIWPNEAKFTPEITKAATELALVEMLKSGTTTFNDMYNPQGVDIDQIYESVKASGMRCYFSPTLFSAENESTMETIEKTKAVLQRVIAKNDDKFKVMVAPHSPYTCSTELLEASLKLAKELSLMLHIHVAETEQEQATLQERYSQRALPYLQSLGYLDHPTVMAHCVTLNPEEMMVLAKSKARVAHNPVSNLKLASGIANIASMLAMDIKVGIATDSVASNNTLDLFKEGRQAALLQKGLHHDATRMTIEKTLKAMTIGGAEVLQLDDSIGSLEVDKQGDFLVIDPRNKPHLYPLHHVLSHLVYAVQSGDVKDVYVGGEKVLANGEVVGVNEFDVLKNASNASQFLYEQ